MSDISNEGKSPWEDDVAAAFEDEDIAQKVSAFLGEKVQPYVTRVEQEAAPNRDAANLYTAFSEQPVETSIQTTRELYGDEIADKFAALLSGGDTAAEAASKVEAETAVDVTNQDAAKDDEPIPLEKLPPEIREQYAENAQKKQREAYAAELDKVIEAHKDELTPEGAEEPQFDKELFHPFVVASQGDFEKAYQAYQNFQNQAKERWGIQVPEAEGATAPPPVMNSTTKSSGTKPPQEVKYESLDQAMDAFFEEHNQAPTTVGSA